MAPCVSRRLPHPGLAGWLRMSELVYPKALISFFSLSNGRFTFNSAVIVAANAMQRGIHLLNIVINF